MRWRATPLGNGDDRIEGAGYALYVAIMAEITKAEKDGLLGLFSGRTWTREQVTWWWQHRTGPMEGTNMLDMPGTGEIIEEMLNSLPPEQRLAGLAPDVRLAGLAPDVRVAGLAPQDRVAGLSPEARLADLAPEQQVLALSDVVLRGLPQEYLGSLPADVQEAIRRRIGTKAPR